MNARDLATVPALEVDAFAPWRAIIESMLHAVWLVDAKTLRVVAVNGNAGTLMGVAAAELVGRGVLDLAYTPEDLCFWSEVGEGLVDSIESETFVSRPGGGTAPVLRRVSRVEQSSGPALYVVALHDRSEQFRAERALEASAADLRATLESTDDGILVTDLSGRIRNFNRRFAALWNIPEEMLTRREDDAVLEWMRRSVVEPGPYMRRLAAMDEASTLQASDVIKLHSGKVLERVATPQCMANLLIGRVFSFRDVTEKLEARERIQVLSYTDALTGLPNRRLLADRVEVALAVAKRENTAFALLFLNLDRFKHINETLGHACGDQVLLEVAERLKATTRQVDAVARLGGDEFVVLAHQADENGAEGATRRVMDALKRPFNGGDLSFTVTASIGIAILPNDGDSFEELMRHSEAAMRETKHAGRAGFRFHRPGPAQEDARSRSRMRLDHAMRQALAQGRFRLHYQPQIEIGSGQIVGAEALIRWRDPELGDVSPGEFIPVAEETGFILPIGDWVLRQAVKQAQAWQASGMPTVVSVNVSALQFQQPEFVDGVAGVLRDAGLAPEWLELELTESILLHDAQDAMLRLQALAQLGVKLAIDDFGTGYSSLAYLKRFPIGRLKIDRSFISGLPKDESDAGIVRAIVSMGRALHLQIIAEGVETTAQRDFLQQAGCDLFQGFLCSPALDVLAYEAKFGRR